MTIPEFDVFIAIDWSGAARNYDGISVAICGQGRSAPKLVVPSDRHWTRGAIADWLARRFENGQRHLIGFDFAFGFPFEPDLGYLGGNARDINDIFALWSLIESKSCGEADFGCMRFINDPDFRALFWTAGPRPKKWIERKRRTEHACAEATGTRPDTLFKLLHSKQVGKASLTGIRVLRHLRCLKGDCVAIWPFETVAASTMVEIYPTIFRKVTTGFVAKLRSRAGLNDALQVVQSRPLPDGGPKELSDHDSDALLSAAGLRWIARDPRVWTPAEVILPNVQREGWIFSVNTGPDSPPFEKSAYRSKPRSYRGGP